ncbi:MAG: hypothetical protein II897_04190 [Clostridia bacterium]|nr:hypothetical protein [Clostridia bacterium]
MRRKGMTIMEAAEEWVHEMNAFPYDMILKLMQADFDDWTEVTMPSRGDRVYVYGKGSGEITDVLDDDYFGIVIDNEAETVRLHKDDFEVEYDSTLPMWGWMWSFGDSADDYWLEELGGIEIMSQCGFRVYESGEFGYFFGIDGAGYDFYESHWIPLYKARGLQWHDEMTESGSYVMDEYRRSELYAGLLSYIVNDIPEQSTLVEVLNGIGFSDKEIESEGLAVIGGDKE